MSSAELDPSREVSGTAPSEFRVQGTAALESAQVVTDSNSNDISEAKREPSPEHLALFTRGLLTKGLKNGHNTLEYQQAAFDIVGHTDLGDRRNIRRFKNLLIALDLGLRRTPEPTDRDLRDDELASRVLKPSTGKAA